MNVAWIEQLGMNRKVKPLRDTTHPLGPGKARGQDRVQHENASNASLLLPVPSPVGLERSWPMTQIFPLLSSVFLAVQ